MITNLHQMKIRIPPELRQHVKKQAALTDRSMAGYIVHIVRQDAQKTASEGKPASTTSNAVE